MTEFKKKIARKRAERQMLYDNISDAVIAFGCLIGFFGAAAIVAVA